MDEDVDYMAVRPIHEMRFAEFANAIVPGGGAYLSRGDLTPRDDHARLATLWNIADRRVTHYVAWRRSPLLAQALPPNARRYEFHDVELCETTSALGLDSKSQQDIGKTAELVAIRMAWLAAVQSHGQQLVDEGRNESFDDGVADDFVRLSCQWMAHPWVKLQLLEYRTKKLAQQPAAAPVFSSDPSWPNTQVIVAESYQAQNEADYLAERESIDYWLNKFDTENRGWSSAFAIDAWDAADDIVIAKAKIDALERLLDSQRKHVQNLEQVVKQNKRRDAELFSNHSKPGRPHVSPKRQAIAQQFTAKWVKSLMTTLEVKSCARLEDIVRNSSQRNWRRWLSGHAVPTQSSLTDLQAAKVVRGQKKGLSLKDIATTPTYDELLQLVRLVPLSQGRLPSGLGLWAKP
ncbi:hypothetical protein [Propionivibrio sp.]|uniref:hypothetical protein n=1 Tax=Propionivibrio sp. TaxID=2212460 RepID=UPI003BF203C9